MVCNEHMSLVELITSVRTNIAAMRAENKAQKEAMESMEKRIVIVLEKLTKKAEKHDMWFYIAYGTLLCCGYAIAQIGFLVKL